MLLDWLRLGLVLRLWDRRVGATCSPAGVGGVTLSEESESESELRALPMRSIGSGAWVWNIGEEGSGAWVAGSGFSGEKAWVFTGAELSSELASAVFRAVWEESRLDVGGVGPF